MSFKSFSRSRIKSALFFSASFSALTAITVPVLAQDLAQGSTEAVIVTGTRVTGMTAADSAAPITVIGSDALSKVGQPNLIQALAQIAPSFTAESFGGDTAALTLSARLRGLSPNDTLVLVNGKRRHSTGNLHVLGGQYQGAATADLDLIPVAAIDHVEVLTEGAAAVYGTDAIAGVVNIILKKNSSGGTASLMGGQYFDEGGQTYDINGNIGFDLFGKGFLSITGERRFRGFSQRGGQDIRLVDANGNPRTVVYPIAGLPDYPRVNNIAGDPQSVLTTVAYNMDYALTPNITLYSFGTYGERQAKAFENYRQPSQVIASPVLGVVGTFTTPGELIPFPLGFRPQEGMKESDYGYTLGFKGDLAGWNWDFSSTYGKDRNEIYTLNSANRSLFIDTHFTPTTFYNGTFTASEATFNLDVSREFEVGLASPLTLAFGAEGRENTFAIGYGDAASRYKEGGQSYPGFQITDAGAHSRKNYSLYLNLAASPIKDLTVDVAGRFEHYTDFGDAKVGKITARYDITPMFAVRGTLSTGFRAPTMQEQFYSATNVSPTSAIVQLPPNSAAARLLGVQPLKPEESTSYSAGIVAHPLDNLSITLDAYSISLRNRIVGTGTLFGSGGAINSPVVTTAIIANGNVLDPTVTQTGVALFVNGISTLTQGVDLSANYLSDFGEAGSVAWTLAGNYSDTSISKTIATPATLAPGVTLFSQTTRTLLTHASPKFKIGLSGLWSIGDFAINLRETVYGPTSADYSPNGGIYYTNKVPTTPITDLDISYNFLDSWTFTVGANNLLNESPPGPVVVNPTTLSTNGNVVGAPLGISPFGINGGFYYSKLTFNF